MQITLNFKVSGPLFDGRYATLFDREMLRATQDSIRLVSRNIRAAAPVGATGNLRSGIHGRTITPIKGVIKVEGPAARYAIFSERGRRAGRWPPPAPIRLWVRKILRPPAKELRSVTFLVQRKIGQKGTKGAKFFRSTAKKSEAAVQRIFQRAVQRFERAMNR
jgi:hypothetical protein